MKYIIVAVRDRKADAFGMPHYNVSRGSAIRNFGDEINRGDENNLFNKHPGDFDLWELGSYDDQHGKFTLHEEPVQVAIGDQLKRKE